MKNQNNKVWAGVEQLSDDAAFVEAMERKEFFELPVVEQLSQDKSLDLSSNRRDFLKYLGFGLGGATIAASCDIPVKRAIPYVVKPDTIVPGVATYYASSFVKGGDYCSILVKTREGRPIKVEGNSMSKVTMGGTSARTQASVLSLYDTNRIPSAQKKGAEGWGKISWNNADKEIAGKLNAGAQIRIVTNTILSPTTKKVLGEFKAKFPNTKVVTYDPVSSSAILQANQQSFGKQAIPEYRFDNAKVIVSFNADFLGTWISPIEYAAQYITNRKIKDTKNPQMSRHIQVESHMSMTGSNADNRILVRPSEQGAAIVTLYNEIVGGSGGPKVNDKAAAGLKKVAAELKANRGASLVVSGSNNVGEQILVNAINNALGNYGKTINWDVVSNQRQGIDKDIQDLIVEMKSGGVDAVLVMDNANPAWDLPNSADFVAGFAKVGTKVSFSGLPNETGDLCDYITPTNHFLESWGDAEPKSGHLSLIQPTISPIFETRQAEISLLKWAGSANLDMTADQPYFEYLKKAWQASAFTQQNNFATFNAFWDSALHDGVFHSNGRKANLVTSAEGETVVAPIGVTAGAFSANVNTALSQVSKPSNAGVEVSFYETVNMGAGQYANNPWLQEMPDPVMRTVWGNYVSVPIGWDGDKFTAMNDLNPNELYGEANKVNVTVNGSEKEMTAVRQFGQMQNTVAIALGNGRKVVGLSGKNVGVNVNPWLSIDANGNTQYYSANATVSESIGVDDFACVQYHDTMGVKGKDTDGTTINVDEKALATVGTGYQGALTNRSIIFQANLKELGTFTHDLKEKRAEFEKLNSHTLYKGYDYKYDQGHHWGMYIDLNACIGCGACQVACIAENNVPVVGKNEVFRHHEMTWLRIDRYFFGDYENPNVVYQPMMCQHCDNAPCENVCPVAATNHSSEGLNQMTYNRCIGTRYCANNCPYKVRRFNWLDYSTADIFPANEYTINGEDVPYGADNLTRMVLNPDVTVRSRGVIEKCSFCVQRIQEGKLTAKKEMRGLRDGEVKTACQTSCPTGAIIFGDTNNKKSAVAQNIASPLNFRVIEETNTDSSVYYSSKIVNRDEAIS